MLRNFYKVLEAYLLLIILIKSEQYSFWYEFLNKLEASIARQSSKFSWDYTFCISKENLWRLTKLDDAYNSFKRFLFEP